MSLTNLKDLLAPAQEEGYAVAAFDVVNTEYASAIVRAAEKERSPVIIMVLEGYLRYFDMELLVPSLLEIAGRATVPVAVHLDHATEWGTVVRAVKAGCTSVMLDCSTLSYEENVNRTKAVVSLCRAVGVSVESEIGSVQGDEAIGQTELVSSDVDEQYFTNVEEAGRFVTETEVDVLAISVGNTHGLYKGEPKLDLARIEQVASRTEVPLALHGGSGISDHDFRNAIKKGMCKVNINTALVMAAGMRLKKSFDETPEGYNYPELLLSAHQAVENEARHFMRLFGCSDKA